jgi:hypothetical protein
VDNFREGAIDEGRGVVMPPIECLLEIRGRSPTDVERVSARELERDED